MEVWPAPFFGFLGVRPPYRVTVTDHRFLAEESVSIARAFATEKDWPQLALSLLWMASLPIGAATTGKTNETAISYVAPSITFEPAGRSEIFADRFFEEISASDSIVFDRFTGPASQLAWARKENDSGYASLNRFNVAGARMFGTIAFDSLRTAAVEALPLDLWQDHWQGWFSDFIAGTIGHPEEEHVEMTSISYSAVRSSWESMNKDTGIQWGLRPWRTSPYVYFLAHAGRLNGRSLLTFEGRAGYTMFGSSKIEGRLTLQLPASFHLAGGMSVDPARVGSRDPGATQIGVTLERVVRFGGINPDAVFYLGFRSGGTRGLSSSSMRREDLIVAGISKRW